MKSPIKIFKSLIFSLGVFFTLIGCSKDETPNAKTFSPEESGFLLVNEGQFGKSNGSLSFIDENGSYILNDVYDTQNGTPLNGDIFQSIQFNKGKAYLVINNSNKIIVVDSTTFEFIEEITGISSPREKVFHGTKSFISRLFTNSISVFESNVFSESVEVGGDAEKMVISDNKLFIPVKIPFAASSTTKGLQVINLSDLTDITLIQTINGAESLAKDASGNLWLLCSGGFQYDTDNPKTAGRIYKINPTTLEKTDSITFDDVNFAPTDLKNAVGSSNIYFREGSKVFQLNTSSTISYEEVIASDAISPYGFLVDEKKNLVFVTDAIDYSSQGDIWVYNLTTKTLKNTLKSDVGPSKIYPRY
jgi:hypothetical protein